MPEASWLEISITVDGELVEPVAEVLSRFIPDGVVVESTAVSTNPDDSGGHAVGPMHVFGFLPVDDQVEHTRLRLEEALWYLGRIRPLPETQFRFIQQADWAEEWKKHYHPINVGEKIMIVPAWLEPPSAGHIPIKIEPGMAFGTGTHPTTHMCLLILESLILTNEELNKNWYVIDLGCGTAILAIAAIKLGARRALGVDIDADAIHAARENAIINQVEDRLELGLGSLAEIRAGNFGYQRANVVLANILAPVLIKLLNEGLASLLFPQGCIVLSGILSEQAEEVEAAARQQGLCLVDRRQIDDWITLCCRLGVG